MPECRNTEEKVSPASLVLPLGPPDQSGIGIPVSTSVRYRWSRIIPVVPSYANRPYMIRIRNSADLYLGLVRLWTHRKGSSADSSPDSTPF
jgi:hypothetical protein